MKFFRKLAENPSIAHLNRGAFFRAALIVIIYLAVFGVLDWLTLMFEESPGVVAWYPPTGLSFALLLTFGARFAPALALSSILSSFLIYRIPQPPGMILIWSVILAFIYGLVVSILRRLRFDWRLPRLRDLVWLILTAVFVSAALGVLAVPELVMDGGMEQSEILLAILHWWIGDVIGVLTITPFLLVHGMPWVKQFTSGEKVQAPRRWNIKRPRLSLIGQVFSLAFMIYWVFGAPVLAEFQPLYLILLPIIWIALDVGFKGVTIGLLAMNVGAIAAEGWFGFDLARLGELQLLMLVICVVGLVMGKVVTQQRMSEAELAEKAGALEASMTEQARLLKVTHRRAEQLAAARESGIILAETLRLDEIYTRLAKVILSLLPDSATLFVARYDDTARLIHAVYGLQDDEVLDVSQLPPIPLEEPNSGTQSRVIHSRQPLILNNFRKHIPAGPKAVVGVDDGRETQSALYVPMLARGQVVGVIQVQSYSPGRYEPVDAELLSLIGNTAAVAILNAQLFSEASRRLQDVESLRRIDRAITSSLDLKFTLSIVIDQTVTRLGVDAASVLLINRYTQQLEFAVGRGFRSQLNHPRPIRVGEGVGAGLAALERRRVEIRDIKSDRLNEPKYTASISPLLESDFVMYYAVPLIVKGAVAGVMEVFRRKRVDPAREWLDYLETLAGQAAIAVNNLTLFDGLQKANLELAMAYDATIEGWSRALDLRDKETEGHTLRVAEMTMKLARAATMTEEQLVHVRRGALLHDIGKMGVPDAILLKPGTLTAEEWEIMRQHPLFSYDMLSPIDYLKPALDIPYCHHEKWDGTGYPRRLKGEQIPLAARLFAVVDVWDALRSDRPYRQGWSEPKVHEYIRAQSGIHFDPHVVDLFFQVVEA